jgi:hypothetical protein
MQPLEPPKQLTLVTDELQMQVSAAGSVTVNDATDEQPLLSFTVTVYVPAGSPVMLCVVAPVLQL